MNEKFMWREVNFGESYLISYAEAALVKWFNADDLEPLQLMQSDGNLSGDIRVGSLKEGLASARIEDYTPHLMVMKGEVPSMVIQFVDGPQTIGTPSARPLPIGWIPVGAWACTSCS